MPTDVTMPKLSDSMEEGRIVRWVKQEGDTVEEGEILVEIESDKAVMELESFYGGTVTQILKQEDDIVEVGDVIAIIAEPGEQADPVVPSAPAEPDVPDEPDEPAPEPPTPAAPRTPAPAVSGARVKASPLARKLAAQKGIDIATITGTGPGGRILQRDVEAATGDTPPPVTKATPSDEPTSGPEHEADPIHKMAALDLEMPEIKVTPDDADIEPVSFNQLAVIRHVTASKHVIPHFYVTSQVMVEKLIAAKDAHKADTGATVTHYIMRAAALALKQFPIINSSYDRKRIIKWKKVNVGLVIEAERGLMVAVAHDVAETPLAELAKTTRALVDKARAGRLSMDERSNPTFVISNMGMYDVESFSAIINPPASTALAVGAAISMPVALGDAVRVAPVMKMTLSADHRIINGVDAAKFLAEMKRLLENPDELL